MYNARKQTYLQSTQTHDKNLHEAVIYDCNKCVRYITLILQILCTEIKFKPLFSRVHNALVNVFQVHTYMIKNSTVKTLKAYIKFNIKTDTAYPSINLQHYFLDSNHKSSFTVSVTWYRVILHTAVDTAPFELACLNDPPPLTLPPVAAFTSVLLASLESSSTNAVEVLFSSLYLACDTIFFTSILYFSDASIFS